MADLIEWLDLHAGALQGLTAIGILLLTIVLAVATVWYATAYILQDVQGPKIGLVKCEGGEATLET